MKEHDLKVLGEAILHVITPNSTPNRIIKALRKAHPEVTKKELVRAAFYALIAHADTQPDKASALHHFAITQRGSEG